jgi:hypothetical protein
LQNLSPVSFRQGRAGNLNLPDLAQIKGLRLLSSCTTDIDHLPCTGMARAAAVPAPGSFEIRFAALSQYGTGLSFPCDGTGQVDLDALSCKAKREYLYARAMIGLEYAYPVIARLLDTS